MSSSYYIDYTVLDQTPIQSDLGHHLFKVKSNFFAKSLEEVWKRKREAEAEAEEEAEAVDGRLKKAEAKEKLTAVPSLVLCTFIIKIESQNLAYSCIKNQ